MRSCKMYYEQLGMLGDWWLYDWITDDEYAILSEKLLRNLSAKLLNNLAEE